MFSKVFSGMVFFFFGCCVLYKTLLSMAEWNTQGTSPWICLLIHYLGRRMVLPWPLSRVVTVAVLCTVVRWHISSEPLGVPGQCWITDQGCLQYCSEMTQTRAHHRSKVWLISAICCGQGGKLYCMSQEVSIPYILTAREWLDLAASVLIFPRYGDHLLWVECFRHNLDNLALLTIPNEVKLILLFPSRITFSLLSLVGYSS